MFSALGPRLWIRMEKLVQILQAKLKKSLLTLNLLFFLRPVDIGGVADWH